MHAKAPAKAPAAPQGHAAGPEAPQKPGSSFSFAQLPPRSGAPSAAGGSADPSDTSSRSSYFASPAPSPMLGLAQRALGSPGAPLPHAEAIQRSFGPGHDLGSVRAHQGKDAARAAADVNAHAFALGNEVAFSSAPDLRTAAHEAAHVVQQRAGAGPASGLGQRGDSWERQADAIADRVVSGGDASALLPPPAPSGRMALQRDEPEKLQPFPKKVTATLFGDPFEISIEYKYAPDIDNGPHFLLFKLAYKGQWGVNVSGSTELKMGFTGLKPDDYKNATIAKKLTPNTSDNSLRVFDIDLNSDFPLKIWLDDKAINDIRPTLGIVQREHSITLRSSRSMSNDAYEDHTRFQILDLNLQDKANELKQPAKQGDPPKPKFKEEDLDPSGKPLPQGPPKAPTSNAIPPGVAAADKPSFVGGIWSTDLTFGGFKDRFRVTVQPISGTKAIFGLSALVQKQVTGGGGAELTGTAPFEPSVLKAGGDTVELALHKASTTADLTLTDALTKPAKEYDVEPVIERDRNHTIKVKGPEIGGEKSFDFRIRYGYAIGGYSNPSATDKIAEANAAAVSSLPQQLALGGVTEELERYEAMLVEKRTKAFRDGYLSKELYEAWGALAIPMQQLVQQSKAGKVNAKLQEIAADSATELYKVLDTAKRAASVFGGLPTGLGQGLADAIKKSSWDSAYTQYRQLVNLLDAYIYDQYKSKGGKDYFETTEFGYLTKATGEIEKIRSKPGIRRIAAVFYPDSKYKDAGNKLFEVPLSLYAWKEGDTWHLKDLTNPENTFEDTFTDAASTEPPLGLFKELDYKGHFPLGIIHWQIPGGTGGQLPTTERMGWSDWLGYIGMGLAAIGLVVSAVATQGTTLALFGEVFLAGGALVGGAAAAADMLEKSKHGHLETVDIVIDVAQIVASVATLGSMGAGKLVVEGAEAAGKGADVSKSVLRLAPFASRAYIPLRAVNLGADAICLAAMTDKFWSDLKELEKKSSGKELERAYVILITQAILQGGLLVMSISGTIPELKTSTMPRLRLRVREDGAKIIEVEPTSTGTKGGGTGGKEDEKKSGTNEDEQKKKEDAKKEEEEAKKNEEESKKKEDEKKKEDTGEKKDEGEAKKKEDEAKKKADEDKKKADEEKKKKEEEEKKKEPPKPPETKDEKPNFDDLPPAAASESSSAPKAAAVLAPEDIAKVRSMAKEIAELRKQWAAATGSKKTQLANQIEDLFIKQRKALVLLVRKIHPSLSEASHGSGGWANLWKITIDGREYFGTVESLMDFTAPTRATVSAGDKIFTKSGTYGSGTVEAVGALGGTGAQGRVNPFARDIDLAEQIKVTAPTAAEAGDALAKSVQKTVATATAQGGTGPTVVLDRIVAGKFGADHPTRAGKVAVWSPADVAAGYIEYKTASGATKKLTLADALMQGGENVNTFWRGPIDDKGTIGEITKTMRYEATGPKGESFFDTPRTGQAFQTVAFGKPLIHDINRPERLQALEAEVVKQAQASEWLKAVKRAYTVARMQNDLQAMNELAPLMAAPSAERGQLSEAVSTFRKFVVDKDGSGKELLTADQAKTRALDLADRLSAVDPALGEAMKKVVADAGADLRGNNAAAKAIKTTVEARLDQKISADTAYIDQVKKVLVGIGMLPADAIKPPPP